MPFMLLHAGKYRRWIKNTENKQTKHNPQKTHTSKHSKTKLSWFGRLLWRSAKKQGELILQQLSQAQTGQMLKHMTTHSDIIFTVRQQPKSTQLAHPAVV